MPITYREITSRVVSRNRFTSEVANGKLCTIDDPGAGNYTLNLEGGSAHLVDTPTPARARVVAPGVLV